MDEVSSGFDLIPHQNRENLVNAGHIFQFDFQQRPDFRIHRRFPELIRIHFAETFVALDTEPLLAFIEDRLDQFSRRWLELFLTVGFDLYGARPKPIADGESFCSSRNSAEPTSSCVTSKL